MAKNWQNSGFVAKFLTKFALFDEQKMAFLAENPLEPVNSILNNIPNLGLEWDK